MLTVWGVCLTRRKETIGWYICWSWEWEECWYNKLVNLVWCQNPYVCENDETAGDNEVEELPWNFGYPLATLNWGQP